ncbi:hypothetical protein SAY87_000296 [Trapa incisa]|uniref:DHFR domain-containing protein n=1 Tax=Trapa incisa TaxID=236973 RepID=A0AAN7GBI0_9MYRT|nr:hypothetical protein SAY87_000296 [Trapa incisa]
MASDSTMCLPDESSNGNTEPGPGRTFQVVVAATREMGIGMDGKLPWKLPADMKFFKELTSGTSEPGKKNAVVMGRKTWESIPSMYRPLTGRLNVVLTRSGSFDIATAENVLICGSMSSALEMLASSPYSLSIEKVFVIGGGEIYREALNAPQCDAIHITEIDGNIKCDTFIPVVDTSLFHPWYSSFPIVENNIRFAFTTYVRVRSSHILLGDDNSVSNGKSNKLEIKRFDFMPKLIFERHEEYLYLSLVENILLNGTVKDDRTGTGTISKFGCQMRFNLRRTFPLLTTKKVFWRGVVEELLWFISGSTNAKILQDKGIHIWDGNASREYLDSIGLKEREEGDLGPVYGFQWRHFGARYTDMHTDYTGQGFDQLLDVINKIKNNPDDRRIILSAWNPSDLKLMALPPCHMFAQFYVANGELSCQMYQRSADMGLGVPFNIASYALLTRMIAHICDLNAGDFVHVIGDAHVYRNHIRPLEEQFQKAPRPFPDKMRILQSHHGLSGTEAPKKDSKAPPPSSKPAKSGGGKQKKKKWSKGKQKEKVNNMVLFDQATYDKLLSEAPKYKLITPSILSDRLRINGSLARKAIKEMMARGLIRMVSAHAKVSFVNLGFDASVMTLWAQLVDCAQVVCIDGIHLFQDSGLLQCIFFIFCRCREPDRLRAGRDAAGEAGGGGVSGRYAFLKAAQVVIVPGKETWTWMGLLPEDVLDADAPSHDPQFTRLEHEGTTLLQLSNNKNNALLE